MYLFIQFWLPSDVLTRPQKVVDPVGGWCDRTHIYLRVRTKSAAYHMMKNGIVNLCEKFNWMPFSLSQIHHTSYADAPFENIGMCISFFQTGRKTKRTFRHRLQIFVYHLKCIWIYVAELKVNFFLSLKSEWKSIWSVIENNRKFTRYIRNILRFWWRNEKKNSIRWMMGNFSFESHWLVKMLKIRMHRNMCFTLCTLIFGEIYTFLCMVTRKSWQIMRYFLKISHFLSEKKIIQNHLRSLNRSDRQTACFSIFIDVNMMLMMMMIIFFSFSFIAFHYFFSPCVTFLLSI